MRDSFLVMNKPNPSQMCAPGYHVVRGHTRVCESGTSTWVDAHVRKNHGKIRPGLLQENIWYLFWNNKKKYPALKPILGFKNNGAEYDEIIQYWLDYWKAQGIAYPEDLKPLMIKAMIALESGFNEKAKSKKSTAEGLMQIRDQMLRILGGFPDKKGWIESKSNLIHVIKTDKIDPIINIALGVRLLGHKFHQMKKTEMKDAWALIGHYNSNKEKPGKEYADKVRKLYDSSK